MPLALVKLTIGLTFKDLVPSTLNHLRLPVALADDFVRFPGYDGPLEVGGFVGPIVKHGPSSSLDQGREIAFTHNLTGVDVRRLD